MCRSLCRGSYTRLFPPRMPERRRCLAPCHHGHRGNNSYRSYGYAATANLSLVRSVKRLLQTFLKSLQRLDRRLFAAPLLLVPQSPYAYDLGEQVIIAWPPRTAISFPETELHDYAGYVKSVFLGRITRGIWRVGDALPARISSLTAGASKLA